MKEKMVVAKVVGILVDKLEVERGRG